MAAAESDDLIPTNPVRKTRFPRGGLVKEKAVIAPEKIRELLAALPEPSPSLVQLLVFTGIRIGELLALRWRDVDLESGALRVTQSVHEGHFDEPKCQRSKRSLPLGAKSVEIFSARKPAGLGQIPTLWCLARVWGHRSSATISRIASSSRHARRLGSLA